MPQWSPPPTRRSRSGSSEKKTTSALEQKAERLLALLKEFQGQGISSILISHKLNEIEQKLHGSTENRELIVADRPDVVYVCGPEPMQRIVVDQCAAAGVPCQVSLERLMACGIGACLSCVVSTTSGLKRACVDGPVFDAKEVCFDASEIPPKH
mgnify:CR=1 FL=1